MNTAGFLPIGAATLCGALALVTGCDRAPSAAGSGNANTPATTTAATSTPSDAARQTPPSDPSSLPSTESPPALAPPPAPANPSGPPEMAFASSVFDFGRIPETRKHLVRLGFTNFGGETLEIKEVKTSCGCTAASLMKRTYGPGESGHIEVTYKPSAPGDQKQTVNVFTNGAPEPVRLTIQADVEPFLEIEPRMLRLGPLPYRKAYFDAVAVWSPDENFRIVNVSTSNPHVIARVLPESEAMRYTIEDADPDAKFVEIQISPDAPWGGLVSWLDVTISGRPTPGAMPITHASKVRIMADMFGALHAMPNTVRFGVAPGAAFERRIRLSRPDGQPLDVTSAIVQAPRLPDATVAVERVSMNEVDLVFTATGPERLSQYGGKVIVRTDVPGEELVEVPILGVVRNSPAGVR